jgi:ubiquinone/menaquinone biosynthesis C-methylase UbiE/diadenosine tetraphosphate (Ap4A) HIT family hydrolase
MTNLIEDSCELCDEALSAGTWATSNFRTSDPTSTNYSRLIRRGPFADVIAGLGAIIPGYVLVIPRTHVLSIGHLQEAGRQAIFDAAWNTADIINHVFGHDAVLVEHGSSANPANGSRGPCIEHAHVHVFPMQSSEALADFIPPGSVEVRGTRDLHKAAQRGVPYYYCSDRPDHGWMLDSPRILSQHARKVWSRSLDRDEEWDWAVYPNFDNCIITAECLRCDRAPSPELAAERSAMDSETIAAYNESAAEYGRRTREFRDDGILEAEITALLASSEGTVLDAGCGAGRDTDFIAGCGRAVIALDASRTLLDLVPTRAGITKVLGDARCIPLDNDSIGAVWCSALLLHFDVADCHQALRELFRVLIPGGLAHISVKEGIGHSRQRITADAERFRHFYYYERSMLTSIGRSAGFSVVNSWVQAQPDSSDINHQWRKFLFRKN